MSKKNIFTAVVLAGAIGWLAGTRADDPRPAIDAPRPEGELIKQKLALAKRGFDQASLANQNRLLKLAPAQLAEWSKRIVEAEMASRGRETEIELVAAHRDRLRNVAEFTRKQFDDGVISLIEVNEADYQLLEAESWLLQVWVGEGN